MEGSQLEALLNALNESRSETRADLTRLHDRVDKALSEAASAAIAAATFQATTTLELKNLGGRFDIQNGRLWKLELKVAEDLAKAQFTSGEAAARRRMVGTIQALVGIMSKPGTLAIIATVGGALIAATRWL